MTSEETLDLAYEVLRPGSPLAGELRARAAALLLRQALERAVAEAWREAGYEPEWSMRAQLLCLRDLVDESTVEEAADLWGQLSGISHHHPYALAPTEEELSGVRARVQEVVGRLRTGAR
ncbi:MAG: hypothetical protein M3O70_29245 [Actinomycetota bacterium]|nr:hypothetical protein [Actinomycetota bacterium]